MSKDSVRYILRNLPVPTVEERQRLAEWGRTIITCSGCDGTGATHWESADGHESAPCLDCSGSGEVLA